MISRTMFWTRDYSIALFDNTFPENSETCYFHGETVKLSALCRLGAAQCLTSTASQTTSYINNMISCGRLDFCSLNSGQGEDDLNWDCS